MAGFVFMIVLTFENALIRGKFLSTRVPRTCPGRGGRSGLRSGGTRTTGSRCPRPAVFRQKGDFSVPPFPPPLLSGEVENRRLGVVKVPVCASAGCADVFVLFCGSLLFFLLLFYLRVVVHYRLISIALLSQQHSQTWLLLFFLLLLIYFCLRSRFTAELQTAERRWNVFKSPVCELK